LYLSWCQSSCAAAVLATRKVRRKVKITVQTERKAKIMTKLTLFLAVPHPLLLMGSKKDIGL